MKTVANVLWIIFFGWWYWIYYVLVGVLCCVSIIFIPVGLQCFKFAKLMFAPFGKTVTLTKSGGKMVINVIWAILFGWENALAILLSGVVCCITIIGIPVGLQLFKAAKFILLPIGATIS